jgi:DNA-binding response OmpR family regulator
MMNLLSNAFKFTKAGGRISVLLEVSAGQIIISVCDTGPGIPDSEKERIFERFYQSGTDGLQSMGSGIGLHIVREYVRLQGGEITVNNQPEGPGSVFRFTIPLKKETHPLSLTAERGVGRPVDESTDSKSNYSPPSEGGAGSGCLLLVDDNRDLLSYMSQALTDDYNILTAQNGQEALEQLKENDVDIIVSDVMMPEMDGLELTRRVKTDINTSHIPIILLTAKAMSSDELQGLEAGADDYVTKPFSMDILRRRILNLVERSQDRHQRFAKEMNIEPSEITVTSIDEQFIARAISIVEAHFEEPDFSVEQLSSEIGLHRSKLYTKIVHLTGKTPVQFIRLLRLKRGKQLLEQSGLYVSEVAYKVGFSPRNFSKYFKEEFGITPKEFTNKQEDTE